MKTNLCMYIEFLLYSDGANSDPRLNFNSIFFLQSMNIKSVIAF